MYGIPFDAVVVFISGYDFLFKSTLGHGGMELFQTSFRRLTIICLFQPLIVQILQIVLFRMVTKVLNTGHQHFEWSISSFHVRSRCQSGILTSYLFQTTSEVSPILGQKYKNIFFRFWCKWKQQKVLLKSTILKALINGLIRRLDRNFMRNLLTILVSSLRLAYITTS